MGLVGQIINGTTFSLMGFGGYFFPFIIVGTGLILLMDRFKNNVLKVNIALWVILFCFLIILDSINTSTGGILDRIQNGIILSKTNQGGGLLGSLLGFFFYKLFGSIGTYILLSVFMTISILIITNSKVKDVIKKASELKPSERIYKDKPNIPVKKMNLSPNDLLEINQVNMDEIKEEEIVINDYTKGITNKENNTEPIKEKLSDSNLKNGSKNIETEIKEKNIKISSVPYKIPSLNLLISQNRKYDSNDKKEILNNARIIEETMKNFGIDATISNINKGPTITCYELSPAPGIKLSRIVSLSDNIALSLASSDIRIEAPIPGKSAVGIEVPNKTKDNVLLKEILQSKEYLDANTDLPLSLGKDVSGKPIVSSIDKMPHLLIAGATGAGKSVCINTIIMSILFKSSPEDVKLLLIDPKVVELSVYNGIPHLLIPVVTDAKKAAFALNWAVTEMEKRYKLFAGSSVRDITSYNLKHPNPEEKMAKIVIIIDELADLMMVAAQEIEDYICRLAQMARAAGMYLIVATQRPSVDVITGTIKANIPSRISFAVSSQVDSRTILDMAGAEKLLGKGDMLFYPSFYSKPVRLQGAFIGEEEVEKVVDCLKDQNLTNYDDDIIEVVQNTKEIDYIDSDELLPEAIKLVVDEGQASISLLQRRLKVGYARAARIVDEMEARGVIGGYEGSKPRKVLMTKEELEEEF
jgi:S-DNA-T family DNA segregation ATPase FtsK/SpoIIIE